MKFTLHKREVETDYGKEIVIEKRFKENPSANRLWVCQSQDKCLEILDKEMQKRGLKWA